MPPPAHRLKIVEMTPIQPAPAPVPQTAEPARTPPPASPPPAAVPVPPAAIPARVPLKNVAVPTQRPVAEAAAPGPIPAPVPLKNVAVAKSQPIPAPRVPRTVTLRAGTLLAVRIGQTISTDRNRSGDVFIATLARPLVIEGFIIAGRGERVAGEVIQSDGPRFGSGASELAVELVRLATDDRQDITIRTQPYATHAINTAVFGHARAVIPVETYLTFRVVEPIRITERLD